ncbi:MAG: response regulator transcription factor [Eubacterium sp.]|nr:response regulator transcription factor [Eubacterium sp.]
MLKILIVEDEKPISDLIQLNLKKAGYDCTAVYDGKTAADLLEDHTYDLILLDIMLPEINGYELMEYIRPMGIPVIFLTAKASLDDRMRGLTSGAEDYLVKPFEIVELLARINIVLRRYHKTEDILTFKDLTIDVSARSVTRDRQEVELTPKEFDLLLLFVRNVNIILYRDRIYETIWETDWMGDTRTLDLHVQRLRRKLGLKDDLKTVYNTGYRLISE